MRHVRDFGRREVSFGALSAATFLAGCGNITPATSAAALAAAWAVEGDIVALKTQVTANGASVTPQEIVAFDDAIAAAQAGITALTGNTSTVPSVVSSIIAKLEALVPYVPAVAAIITALAVPGVTPPAPAPSPLVVLPAGASSTVSKLGTDLAALRAAG